MNNLKQIAVNTIKRENMINIGDTIVVGVSGGADSVALLHFLYRIKDDYNLTIKVCHVNHKIRTSGTAERDADFVKGLCEEFGVEFYLKEVDIPSLSKSRKLSEELVGREERYKFFNEIAGKYGKIATAHNKNDNVETLLMRLVRGTGLNGLSGIPYKRDNIIRPLLDVEREEIEKYLKDNDLYHIIDETNFETDYTRNKVRLELLPMIKDSLNPNIINSLGDMIRSYSDDNDYIEKQVDSVFNHIVNDDGNINIKELNKIDNAIRARIILRCIKLYTGNNSVSQKIADEVIHLADGCYSSIVCIGNNKYALYKDGYIVFKDNLAEDLSTKWPVQVALNEKPVEIEISGYRIKVEKVNECNVTCNEYMQYVPVDMCKNLVFRTKIIGDRFLAQPGMHQKIKGEMGYMLCSGGEVLWIPGKKAMRLANRNGEFLKFKILDT